MTIQAMVWAFEQTTRSSGQRLVLLALANHANKQDDEEGWVCWPSMSTLSRETQIGESTVRMHVESLVADGLIEKVERKLRSGYRAGSWIIRLTADGSARLTADGSARLTADGSARLTADGSALSDRRSVGAHFLNTEPKSEEPKERALDVPSDADRLLALLRDERLRWNPDSKPIAMGKGAREAMDRMLRLDGRDPATVERMIRFLFGSSSEVAQFWAPNIASAAKLRQQYDQIAEQANRERQARPRIATSTKMTRSAEAMERAFGRPVESWQAPEPQIQTRGELDEPR